MAPTAALSALTLLACVAAAASQRIPPPAAVPTVAPTLAPVTTPTKAPTKAPTRAPTRPRPRCTKGPVGTYLDTRTNTCKKCVISTSPFRTIRGRLRCYPPATLSTSSVVCSPAQLSNSIRPARVGARAPTCLNSRSRFQTIYLPVKSSAYPFLNAGTYTKASLRLNNSIAVRRRNGVFIASSVTVRGVKRYQVVFDDLYGSLRKKRGLTVRITGVLRRDGSALDYCFVSYIRVCR